MAKQKRRFRVFRLCLWVSGILTVGLLALWQGTAMHRHHRAVRHVEALGGFVVYDYQYDADGSVDLTVTDSSRLRGWLSQRIGAGWFHDVHQVSLGYQAVTDDDLQPLGEFRQLRRLELQDTYVTGAGLDSVQDLKHLEFVDLSGTRLTVAGLEALARNRSIRKLNIWDIPIRQEYVGAVLQFERLDFVEWDIAWGENRQYADQLEARFPGIVVYSP